MRFVVERALPFIQIHSTTLTGTRPKFYLPLLFIRSRV